MANYALVSNGVVQNKIVWDGSDQSWQPQPGVIAVVIPDGTVVDHNYTYANGEFSSPSSFASGH
ncbi:hypothetical protein [Burkholderia seminalis]|uniref:hypothetical protein n=1 Tax=Burkholderia seminalis TaxID=488731 RepID=UPI00084F6C07|nr:hypothetical protein [Burkholderia seminalis]